MVCSASDVSADIVVERDAVVDGEDVIEATVADEEADVAEVESEEESEKTK